MEKKLSFSGLAAATMLCLVFALLLLQIIFRYLNIEISWSEELTRWLWVWSVCLGIVEVERQSEHLSIHYFIAKLNKKAQALFLLSFDILTLSIFLTLAWLSILSMMINWDTHAAMIPLSRSFLYLSLLITSLLSVYETMKKVLRKWRLFKKTPSFLF